jgi:hypothetical protein
MAPYVRVHGETEKVAELFFEAEPGQIYAAQNTRALDKYVGSL